MGIIIYSLYDKKEITNVDDNNINNEIPVDIEQKTIDICYYRSTKNTQGFNDVAWLKLNIQGENISGEFQNLPAEKDSKIGSFKGAVGPLDQSIMARRANVWWDSFAEGMKVKEELAILFGDGSATVGFGEMIDKGDGVYVYKDKENLTYIESMSQIDCEFLDERLFTEKYIRDNIRTIATNKPVLGGSWYVTSVFITPSGHNGEVTYEDGHIQNKAEFTYTYEKDPQNVTVTKFEVIE